MASVRKAFLNQLRPHDPAPEELYVDWLSALGLDDVKQVIVNCITGADVSTQVLVTGQRGSGKSTELRRAVDALRAASCFVSLQSGEFVEELGGDIAASDIVYFAAQQLVSDLQKNGLTSAGGAAWEGFWSEIKKKATSLGVEVKGPGGVGFGLSLKDNPGLRRELRQLFGQHQSQFLRVVNEEIVLPAMKALKEHGTERIVMIVDGLGDVPLRSAGDPVHPERTNHEQIFVDNGDLLAGFACDVVYTFPVELAYQSVRLGNGSRGEVLELGVIPLSRRDGSPTAGADWMRAILERRATSVGGTIGELVVAADVDRLVALSGGHLRTVFELLQTAIHRAGPTGEGTLDSAAVDRAIRLRADALNKTLLDTHRAALDHVRQHRTPPPDDLRRAFNELLQSQHVLAYYDVGGTWFAPHPLTDPAVLA